MSDRRTSLSWLTLLTVLVASGCAQGVRPRLPEARRTASIFSPLDLPTPNSVRTMTGAPGPDYWQQRVDYDIDASLDEQADEVAGRATIRYVNNSPVPLADLWLHLEQNLFRRDSIGSVMASSSYAAGADDEFSEGCIVESIRIGDADLPYHVHDTVARVELPEPVAAKGGTVELEVAWRFTVPREVRRRRFGILETKDGPVYEVAQWFPAVAVFDDVHGWNVLPYAGSGEFYTNFGDYDVRLTVPRSHLVGATGVLRNPGDVLTEAQRERLETARDSDETVMIRTAEEVGDPASRPAGEGPLTWHFRAENVRTFAWASSPAFVHDACGLGDVLVQSLYPPEHADLWKDSTQMLRAAMTGYNERLHPYPYPQATNVRGAERGMEYPMIIFCAGRSEQGLYSVTTHEIGHNWFPMLVNSDERRHGWMDEGFNSFINHYSNEDWFEGDEVRPGRGTADRYTRRIRRQDDLVPIATEPDRLPPGTRGLLHYTKTAVGLVILREQVLGPRRFDHAFRTYVRTWAFKSPQPADFFRTMEHASGMDLAWFWRGWFLEDAQLDQRVRAVRHERRDEDAGGGWMVIASLANERDMVMPVVMDVTYENGRTERRTLPVEVWYVADRHEAHWPAPSRVVKIVIDPDQAFPDVERWNNTWRSGW